MVMLASQRRRYFSEFVVLIMMEEGPAEPGLTTWIWSGRSEMNEKMTDF